MRAVFFLLLFLFPTVLQAATLELGIVSVMPNIGTEKKLYGEPSRQLPHELKARVVDLKTNRGVSGIPVLFQQLVQPSKASSLVFSSPYVVSDVDGVVQTAVNLGDKPGDYVVSARIDLQSLPQEEQSLFSLGNDLALYELAARDSLWPMIIVMELMAGTALFMYGISQLSTGMRNAAGSKLRRAMQLVTHNRFLAMTMGIFITILFQSSSATTVMLVSFVQAGLLKAVQSLALILGADIGTTLTVQLFAFNITDYTLFGVAIGFFIFTFGKRAHTRAVGQSILGLGLLFFGMSLMQHSTYPLRSYEPFTMAVTQLKSTTAAILIGTVFTALIRSSAAFIGIIIVFASQGIISLESGIALCLGANLGTCVTTALAAINTNYEAKRVALAHMFFKMTGVLALVFFIPSFGKFIEQISGESSTIERQIANAHTTFNVGLALIFLPFLKQFNRLIEFLIPGKSTAAVGDPKALHLEKQLLLTPPLALSAAKKEIIQMGREAQRMVKESLDHVLKGEASVDKEYLIQTERSLDGRYEVIRGYLAALLERDLPEEQVRETLLAMRTLHDIEQIADIVEDRIIPRVEILRDHNIMLSDIGREELQEYHTKVLKQISRSLELFNTLDIARAARVKERFERYCYMAYELKNTHFLRLQNHIPESEQTTNVHLNLVSALNDISSQATNIARHMMESDKYKDVVKGKDFIKNESMTPILNNVT